MTDIQIVDIRDEYNDSKIHRIGFVAGKELYKQMMEHDGEIRRRHGHGYHPKPWRCGSDGWTDVTGDRLFGYRRYVIKARLFRPMNVGGWYRYWTNQAWRDAEVLAVARGKALIRYTMPRGRIIHAIVKHSPNAPFRQSPPALGWTMEEDTFGVIQGKRYWHEYAVTVKHIPAYFNYTAPAEDRELVHGYPQH